MKKHIFILVVGILLACIFPSCKKNSSSSQNCTLTSISDSTTSLQSVKQFTYDNSGRVTLIAITGQNGGNKAYSYNGNQIIINSTNSSGETTEIDTIFLDNQNLIQTYVSYYPSSDTVESGAYYYDANSIVTFGTNSVNGVIEDTATYNTTNGDLNYELLNGQTTPIQNYSYYESQSIFNGDPTDIKQLLYYGAYYYRNTHMLREFYSTGVFYNNYQYTFSNNRITQVTEGEWRQGSTDTVTHILNYSYSCK